MASTGCSFLATEDAIIDARGLKCPLPVLKLEKRLASASPGALLIVLTTDPMAKIDIPLYCRQHNHTLIQEDLGGVMRFEVTALGALDA